MTVALRRSLPLTRRRNEKIQWEEEIIERSIWFLGSLHESERIARMEENHGYALAFERRILFMEKEVIIRMWFYKEAAAHKS
jgi:hypothetical protein